MIMKLAGPSKDNPLSILSQITYLFNKLLSNMKY